LIVQDRSSKIHTTQTINETQQEWFERESVNDLVIVVVTKNKNCEISYEYYDYLAKENNDSIYVRQAWLNFIELSKINKFSKIHIWSDGGHFLVKYLEQR